MYKLPFYLFFVGLFFLSSCEKSPQNSIQLDEDYELKYGQTANFPEGNFTIRFDEVIEDSRCPLCADFDCFWQGRVITKLIVANDTHPTDIKLSTFRLDSMQTAEYQNYLIELKEVNPVPYCHSYIPESDYRIIFSINEL